MAKILTVGIFLFPAILFIARTAIADCDAILREGIRDKYHLQQKDTEASSWNKYKDMSAQQFEETYKNSVKEGNAAADVVLVWEASGGVHFDETKYKKAIDTMRRRQGDSGHVDFDKYYDLLVETIDPTIMDKYNECKRIESGGLIFWKKEWDNGEFAVGASWRPIDPELPREIDVKAVEAEPGATLIGQKPKKIDASNTCFRFKLRDKGKGATIKISTSRGDYVEYFPGIPNGPDADELLRLREEVAELRQEMNRRIQVTADGAVSIPYGKALANGNRMHSLELLADERKDFPGAVIILDRNPDGSQRNTELVEHTRSGATLWDLVDGLRVRVEALEKKVGLR